MTEVRKAMYLRTLRELNLSEETHAYLTENFYSIEDIVKRGRVVAARIDSRFGLIHGVQKWELELTSALRKAGFIRPIEELTMIFNLGSLYSAVFSRAFVAKIEQMPNELYENFQGFTEGEIELVKVALHNRLSEGEFTIACYRYGLDGESARDLKRVSRYFGMTDEATRQIETSVICKLRKQNVLPRLRAIVLS